MTAPIGAAAVTDAIHDSPTPLYREIYEDLLAFSDLLRAAGNTEVAQAKQERAKQFWKARCSPTLNATEIESLRATVKRLEEELTEARRLAVRFGMELGHVPDPRTAGLTTISVQEVIKKGPNDPRYFARLLTDEEVAVAWALIASPPPSAPKETL